MNAISVRGARTHNLNRVDLDLPRNKLNVITGLSGSGKSSLAYDTIYAEGQRRYVESLSSYARQFLSIMEKPEVDSIEGLSPAISINQQANRFSPRSTVGTATEIYDYLRVLFARVGIPQCPEHKVPLDSKTITEVVESILSLPEGTRIFLLAPVVRDRKGEHEQMIRDLAKQGYVRLRVDESLYEIENVPPLDKYFTHTIEVIVDRLVVRDSNRQRLVESVEAAAALSDGIVSAHRVSEDGKMESDGTLYSTKFGCPYCGYVLDELEPRIFSFNNPKGACKFCNGLGYLAKIDPDKLVEEPALSLSCGAIPGWDRKSAYYFNLLQGLAQQYKFDLDAPFESLSDSVKQIIFYGTGDSKFQFRHERPDGSEYSRTQSFEGIVRNYERRHRDTDSDYMKEKLSRYFSNSPCNECSGSRLGIGPRNVFITGKAIHEVTALNIVQLRELFDNLSIDTQRAPVAERIVRDIKDRLRFLADVGLTYVSLDRGTNSLSGGEMQRIRLASQIGSGLVGVTYVLDEPSVGLHERDNQKLLDTLTHLRNLGNTLIVVEHDEKTIRSADFVVDLGPGAGAHGGNVIIAGTPEEVEKCTHSLTGQYLSGQREIPIPLIRQPVNSKKVFKIVNASGNNLNHIDVEIPLGLFICVTGVSGSGKSTLVNETIYPALATRLYRSKHDAAPYASMSGLEHIDKVISISQQPIGRTPRSNPATYTGLFGHIRSLFAQTPESRARGYKSGRFSFNVPGGRCESCKGDGYVRVEMHFLPDMFVRCEACQGTRYNTATLDIQYKGLNIAEVLDLTVDEALEIFFAVPSIAQKLKTLNHVGLGYIHLGQNAVTLSGGEAQRVKLSLELSKRDTGNTLYILDEPTTGLHFEDIKQLLSVVFALRDKGNTIVIIEHNLEVLKSADWIIDLGPEGGNDGGELIAAGTPEQVAKNPDSHTGKCLAELLNRSSAENFSEYSLPKSA